MRILYFSVATAGSTASEHDTGRPANGYHSLETHLTRFVRMLRSGKMRNDSSAYEIRDNKFALKSGRYITQSTRVRLMGT
jgi:hypothetical protein